MTSIPMKLSSIVLASVFAAVSPTAQAQMPESPAVLVAKQRDAMAQFSYLEGVWRGTAWTLDATGKRLEMTQTERIGPFLEGTVRMIEGRGYMADGSLGFHALGVLSHDLAKKTWSLRSWGQGRGGEFPFTPTTDGYVWTTPAGPNATIRYTAVFKNDTWREIAEYVAEGRAPHQIFEMNLKRVSATTWPEDGAVLLK